MTPAARVQTSIELLDDIIASARGHGAPADRILAGWFREHRFAGSKDRRAIRSLVYAAIRACGPIPESGRAAMLRLAETDEAIKPLFDGSKYGPPAIGENEEPAKGGIAHGWLVSLLANSGVKGAEAAALLDRAPLDLRINRLKLPEGTPDLPVNSELNAAPDGLRLPTGTQIEQWPAFRDGVIEVQDAGSQLACQAVGAQPGETIIDLCAGAGGKTLGLASAMENSGKIIACDTDRGRLSRLPQRAERAGANFIETRLLNPKREMESLGELTAKADAVLVDAPCSGTGTWRRNPDAKWRLTKSELANVTELQSYILGYASRLVKPGGRMIYVTCSLLDDEGLAQVDRFCKTHADWQVERPTLPLGDERGAGIRLSPYTHGTDGFFIAKLRAPC
jgi:16S rRNA (cytosine967-C5)-methyltransferase